MKATQVQATLRELAEQQWGLLTTAQARRRGISGAELQRARRTGVIKPIRHGVHRLVGTPDDRLQALRAEWLATSPEFMAYERFDEADKVTITGPTAAWVHDVGDLIPEPYQLTSPNRHQSRSSLVSFRRRDIPAEQVTLVEGLPVTTLEATVKDLMVQGDDLTLVADVLDEAAARSEFNLQSFQRLVADLDPTRVARVMQLAGLDLDSQTRRLTQTAAGQTLIAEVIQQLMPIRGTLEQSLNPIQRLVAQWTEPAVKAILPKVSTPISAIAADQISSQTRQAVASVIERAAPATYAPFGLGEYLEQVNSASSTNGLMRKPAANNLRATGLSKESDCSEGRES